MQECWSDFCFRNWLRMARIEIYTTRYCGYCQSAKALLNRKGVTFSEIDVTGDPEGRSRMVERANGRMTVPQIFVGATHVGGFDELYDLERAGRLDPLLMTNEAPAGPVPESPAA
jgi:glutaredoxin 3